MSEETVFVLYLIIEVLLVLIWLELRDIRKALAGPTEPGNG